MKLYITLFFCLFSITLLAQQVNIEDLINIKNNKPFTFNGGLSAGTVFYEGNQSGRQPWTYYLNGNLNVNIYGQVNIPISVNITNLGQDLTYPSLPDRLSLHPTYKWITAHVGDVSMTFSPYTLSGHQFTGGGVDLAPGKFKFSVMGGRLLRKVEYSTENSSLMPNYERFGYGAKAQYDDEKYGIGMIYFGAKDNEDIYMVSALDSMGINPMQNSVFSWNVRLSVIKNLTITAEYGISLLTRDTRAPKDGGFFLNEMLGNRTSTSIYHAMNAKLNYQLMKNSIGIAYERIDPDYKTLGGYYFNNDYENITLNYSRPFLKDDKASVAVSFGLQHDDLDGSKEEKLNRYVGAVNLNYNPNEAIQTSLNFSTFQSYRNIKSQFDYINETSPYDNLDTLQFTQLSQNLDASVMYTFQNTETRNQRLSLNASYQEAADRQGSISLPGNVSRFVNTSLGYGLALIPQSINVTSSVNMTYSYAGMIESYTVGPMAGITAGFFQKALNCGMSASYNMNLAAGDVMGKVFNYRANVSYRLKKKHSFNANVVWQNRDVKNKKTDAVTTTVSYAYSF